MLDSIESIKHISQQKYPAKISWILAKVIRKMDIYYKEFINTRDSLIKKYGEVDESGKMMGVKEEYKNQYFGEILELMKQDVDIPINPMKFEDIINDEVKLEPQYLVNIDWLFGEDNTHYITEVEENAQAS